jgi:putative tryptophan/tyrosine transport system substrate-binding protein
MRRRDFTIGLMLGAAVRQVRSQEKGLAVVGFLSSNAPATYAPAVAAFRQGLAETGYIEGQNVAIEYRWAEGHYDRLPALAAELVGRKVAVIAAGSLTAIRAAKSATSTTPIVFFGGDDPVKQGLVASLARPGGNLTGISLMASELMPKRLELLSELVAHTTPLALLVNPNNGSTEPIIPDMQEAARMRGMQLLVLKADSEAEIDTAFATLVQQHASGLVVSPDAVFDNEREHLVALAAHHAVPTIYFAREFVAIGGLISYGASLTGAWHQVGAKVGKILKGAKPADLPVEQPTRFELVINLKTAKALGLTIPPSILARADEVIE